MAKEELQMIAEVAKGEETMEKIRRPTPYGILFRASRDMFAYESPLPWWPPPPSRRGQVRTIGTAVAPI